MMTPLSPPVVMQDHAAFLAGQHDFQVDIDGLVNSPMIDTILRTVMLATQVRFAAVARVTADCWVACQTIDEIDFGLRSGDEIAITSTFCQSVRDTSHSVAFDDVSTDPVYANHPIATLFGIASYASIPIRRSDGSFFGTLCAIDTAPRGIKDPRVMAMLAMFADIIGQGLDTEDRLATQTRLVAAEQDMLAAQERFVAMLSHDLRNPVAALAAGLRQLGHETLTPRGNRVVPLMHSTLHRMHDMIENLMLHAKLRLGGGIRISAKSDAPLAAVLTQVADELQLTAPDCTLTVDLDFDQPLTCDAARIGQAVSNLLSNAITHGTAGETIALRGRTVAGDAVITVTNAGPDISDAVQDKMFLPFLQGAAHSTGSEGLGLGLYIASSIVTAHGGQIAATSADGLTTFTLRIPLSPPS